MNPSSWRVQGPWHRFSSTIVTSRWGGEVCRDRRLGKALGQPSLSLTPQNHQHQPVPQPCQPGWPIPAPKGPETAFPWQRWMQLVLGATGHSPGPPPATCASTSGTEPEQTCLVRASGAKTAPKLSSLVDFSLKTLWGCEPQAVDKANGRALCWVLGRELGRRAQPHC